MTPSAGWSPRAAHSSVVLPDGSIVLMGGLDASGNRNDVWRSTDKGTTWTEMSPSARWSARQTLQQCGDARWKHHINGGSLMSATLRMICGSQGIMGLHGLRPQMPFGRQDVTTRAWQYLMAALCWWGVAVTSAIRMMSGVSSPPDHLHRTRLIPIPAPGIYQVTLQVFNEDGYNSTRKTGYITVNALPSVPSVVNFTGTPRSGPAPLTVSFIDLSWNNPTGWAWFFGDEDYMAPWTQMTANAGWSRRYSHSSMLMPDGSIVLMGGFDWTFKNDVWRSTDKGATWTEVNRSAGWSGRIPTSVVMRDGSIVLMGGGDYSNYNNDTWRSTDNGATWMQAALPVQGGRKELAHSSVVMPDGSIVLTGGIGTTGY